MTGSRTTWDISQAANGMAAITRLAKDDRDTAGLAYLALYACGFAGRGADLQRYRALGTFPPDDAFVAQLCREVPDTVEVNDWKVTGCGGERVFIAKDGMEAFISSHALTSPPEPGASVSFTAPALRTGRMPGFVMREGASSAHGRPNLSRLYLNIRPSAASWALGCLVRRLDAAGLPHDMKVLANPRAYLRRDSCVLYVDTEHEEEAIRLVTFALQDLPHGAVGRAVPRLTGRVAPGLGLAHEPTDFSEEGLSHGQWVARLFGKAAEDTSDPVAIAERVRVLIAEDGRDPSRPYLRSN